MPRPAPDYASILTALTESSRTAGSLTDRAAVLLEMRADPAVSQELDLKLIERLIHQHRALLVAKELQVKLEGVLAKLSAPTWFRATFIGLIASPTEPRALVHYGTGTRMVAFADGVDQAALQVGDGVFLGHELNVIMARAPEELVACGEVCSFERRTGDGRLIVKSRGDEQCIARASAAVAKAELKPGALLRWDPETQIAFETIESSVASPFFLETTPAETFADVGGLNSQIARITDALSLHFEHRDVARRYRLAPVGSILLWGPAGTGKTLVAKSLANWFARHSPAARSFFMNVKPSALGSMWHSESESNIRRLFSVARDTAAAHPGARVLIFFDELDSIGGTRGASHHRVDDKVLTALLSELDGLAARGDVVVIGATNRREALDPALLRPGRFGDLMLEVPRPNRNGARDIFGKHLPTDLPYARNGHGDDFAATRAEIIEAAVATIFAPNGSSELATITFRDGKRRAVRASDLVSGAVIAGIARTAIERACRREIEQGPAGLIWKDVALAIEQQFESAVRVLAPGNCRQHLTGLPHDLDVVNVEPAARKVPHPERFLGGN